MYEGVHLTLKRTEVGGVMNKNRRNAFIVLTMTPIDVSCFNMSSRRAHRNPDWWSSPSSSIIDRTDPIVYVTPGPCNCTTVVSKETVEDICVCKCIRRIISIRGPSQGLRSPKGPVAASPSKQALFERDELKNTLHPPTEYVFPSAANFVALTFLDDLRSF
ncbi:hypothetical protein EVAR_101297_1 [Eumeta japonica]|uniref:Uncharacterized protein n=1 Tax=Eumeta variegata TaxID=151549 RepID=A0A4C1SLE2_EUMVA|nr:hypothetical protein EVAR_101297_1 [Eumeta japonica]